MDSITGATGGSASRLTFAQKAIATGMSVVLAFGLSPLGQVPAYAADKAPQTQSAELLQTQEGENALGDLAWGTGDGTTTVFNNPTLTYDGSADGQDIAFAVYNGAGSLINPSDATNKYTVVVKNGKETIDADIVTGKGFTFKAAKAGTYKVTVTGEGAYATRSKDYEIKVGKLDISELAFAQKADVYYTGNQLTFETECTTDNSAEEGGVDYTGLTEGVDFKVDVENVTDAGDHPFTVTGIGSCEGEATGTVTVEQATLLQAATGAVDANATLNGGNISGSTLASGKVGYVAGATHAISGTADVYTAATAVKVPYNKRKDPVSLVFQVGKAASNAEVPLKQGSDYTVTYYKPAGTSTVLDTSDDNVVAASDIASYSKFWAVVKVRDYSQNFLSTTMGATSEQTLVAYMEVGQNSKLEDFVDHVELASGTYLPDYDLSASKAGATFYDKDGNDVTDLVGEHYAILPKRVDATDAGNDGMTYGILSTNTYNSARLSSEAADTANYPTGAGQYYTYVTGTSGSSDPTADWYTPGDGVIAYYTVLPREASEGTDVGNLEITADDVTFKDGDYVDPSVTVKMYTTKGGTPVKINETESGTGALGSTIRNYTVSILDPSGNKVDKPSAAGTYTAEVTFSGNLDGTTKKTKTFEVGTGDIASIATSIKVPVYDTDGKTILRFDDPSDVYTGTAREIDPSEIVFMKKNPAAGATNNEKILTADDLAGTEFTLSYGTDTASPDPATGKPAIVGAYTVTANFTGAYTGSVSGSYVVNKLNMSNANANAKVQYLQDGTTDVYDDVYSTPKTGSAIEPTVRVVLKDGGDVVEPAVYAASFKDNDKAGEASTFLKVNSGYGAYATASGTAAPVSKFAITDKSFGDIAAAIELSKASADYSAAGVSGLTVKVNSNVGYLTYASNAPSSSAIVVGGGASTVKVTGVKLYAAAAGKGTSDGASISYAYTGTDPGTAVDTTKYVGTENVTIDSISAGTQIVQNALYSYTATLTYSNVQLYKKGDKYYTDAGATTELTLAGLNENLATGEIDTVTFDGFNPVTGTVKVNPTTSKLYATDAQAEAGTYYDSAANANGNAATGKISGAVSGAAKGDADGIYTSVHEYTGASVTYEGFAMYEKSGTYYLTPGATAVTAATSVTDPVSSVALAAAAGKIASSDVAAARGTGYVVRVLGADGEPVDGVTYSSDAPFRTVTINGLKDAGTYTIAVGAGSDGVYGGRLTKEFTVNGIDISDTNAFSYTWTYTNARNQVVKVPFGEEWFVDYNSTFAKTVAGITLGTPSVDDSTTGQIVVKSATGDILDPDTDYTVSYENNKKAGEATITFEGEGNYAGTLSKTFKINELIITPAVEKSAGVAAVAGYRIDFDDAIYDKGTKTYRMGYTGEQLKPAFKINKYKINANTGNLELESVFDDEYTEAWFNNVDVYYGRTGVDDWATVQITATGNYEGTLEASFYIDPVTLTADNATYAVADVAYTGNVAQPKATVTWNGKELVQGKDFA
ncbi:MAG: hypothetical protein IJ087_01945, partial [Eggerthellaceae bacterium]|nr:hypothetical protein [Eggerthellaceae bacterium]